MRMGRRFWAAPAFGFAGPSARRGRKHAQARQDESQPRHCHLRFMFTIFIVSLLGEFPQRNVPVGKKLHQHAIEIPGKAAAGCRATRGRRAGATAGAADPMPATSTGPKPDCRRGSRAAIARRCEPRSFSRRWWSRTNLPAAASCRAGRARRPRICAAARTWLRGVWPPLDRDARRPTRDARPALIILGGRIEQAPPAVQRRAILRPPSPFRSGPAETTRRPRPSGQAAPATADSSTPPAGTRCPLAGRGVLRPAGIPDRRPTSADFGHGRTRRASRGGDGQL